MLPGDAFRVVSVVQKERTYIRLPLASISRSSSVQVYRVFLLGDRCRLRRSFPSRLRTVSPHDPADRQLCFVLIRRSFLLLRLFLCRQQH